MTPEARQLFLEIACCAVMVDCLEGADRLCGSVVLHQADPSLSPEARARVWRTKHHLPEPWVGHLEEAPLLFLSSNPFLRRDPYDDSPVERQPSAIREFNGATVAEHPSLNRPFEAPKADWGEEEIVDKYESMFDVWTDMTGTRAFIDEEGSLDRPSPYWSAARDIASAILGRAAQPGADYALTEAVRCKSPEELGVADAVRECAPRYLERTLSLSPAAVVVVMGRVARQEMRKLTGYSEYGPVSPPLPLAGRRRTVVFLAHPGSRGRSKYPKRIAPHDVQEVRARLGEHRRRRFRHEAGDAEITVRPTRQPPDAPPPHSE